MVLFLSLILTTYILNIKSNHHYWLLKCIQKLYFVHMVMKYSKILTLLGMHYHSLNKLHTISRLFRYYIIHKHRAQVKQGVDFTFNVDNNNNNNKRIKNKTHPKFPSKNCKNDMEICVATFQANFVWERRLQFIPIQM